MITIESRTLSFRNARIRYSISTGNQQQAIVMLHAAFADRHMFEQQLNVLKDHYRVIAVDMPGHGDTVTRGTSVTIEHMPEVVQQLLAENGIGHCHLIGVSLGSLIAQAAACQHPELVRSVTIVGGYSIHKANKRIRQQQFLQGLRLLFYILFSMNRFRAFITTVSCHSEHGRAVIAKANRRFARGSFAAMSGLNRLFVPRETPVDYPLHIMYGEYDQPVARDAAEALNALEPGSRLTMVQGAGHCANLDEPLSFNAEAEQFIRSAISRYAP